MDEKLSCIIDCSSNHIDLLLENYDFFLSFRDKHISEV